MAKKRYVLLASAALFAVIILICWRFCPNLTVLQAIIGDREAMYQSGRYYSKLPDFSQNFRPVPGSFNPDLAAYWYFRAARNGHAGAMFQISEEYGYTPISYNGYRPRWLPFDGKKSREWLNKAAEAGSIDAMRAFFQIYQVSDNALALKWVSKGAEMGDIFCMNEMAKAYRFSLLGLQQDIGKAKYWEDKTDEADRGHKAKYGW